MSRFLFTIPVSKVQFGSRAESTLLLKVSQLESKAPAIWKSGTCSSEMLLTYHVNFKLFATRCNPIVLGPGTPHVKAPPHPQLELHGTVLTLVMPRIWNAHLTVNKLGYAMFTGSLSGYIPKFTFSSFIVDWKMRNVLMAGAPLLFIEIPQIRH